MKRYLEIIKGLGLSILLFVMVSTIAMSENSYTVSVTIVQSSTSGDGDKANTVVNTYSKESDTPGVHVTSEISGSGSSVITDDDNATPDDATPTESDDSNATPPFFQLGELTSEEYNAALSEWITSVIEEDSTVTFDGFPQDTTEIANVE